MTYNVKLVSLTNSIVVIFSSLTIFLMIAGELFPMNNQLIRIPIIILLAFLAWLAWQKFVTGRTEWRVEGSQISVKWLKPFTGANLQDRAIKFPEIEKLITRSDNY